MIDFTPLARVALIPKAKRALSAATDCRTAQMGELCRLVNKGEKTAYGREHGLDRLGGASDLYASFAEAVPVCDYEAFRPYAMRMVDGEADVLWPGRVTRFAQSSGTSGGKSKFVPVTDEALRRNHYPGATASVALYLLNYPDSRMFAGKGFILGGSFANELSLPSGVRVGDLSANLIDAVNPLVNLFRVPNKEIALLEDWNEKLPALIDASIREDITNISGVPSWFLTVLKGVVAKAGVQTIREVWPHLEVFFHGGIAFGPYREEYTKIVGPQMRYWENYNASEGFFACQSEPGDRAMLLLQNVGVFYEFIPLDQIDTPHPNAVPAWEVEQGKTYALCITACNGLWRYAIGDTVRVESVNPLKITIAGRTQHFINAFGEELMVCNADAAIEKACRQMGCSISNYTAAPVYAQGERRGRHQWLIEWNEPPADVEAFADLLDRLLQQENSDYQAKRQGGIFLDRLELISAKPGLFDRWLALSGKLGGQRKIPRLSNSRKIIDQLLQLNSDSTI